MWKQPIATLSRERERERERERDCVYVCVCVCGATSVASYSERGRACPHKLMVLQRTIIGKKIIRLDYTRSK